MFNRKISDYIVHMCLMNDCDYRRLDNNSVLIKMNSYDTPIEMTCKIDEENGILSISADFKTGEEKSDAQKTYMLVVNNHRTGSQFKVKRDSGRDITNYFQSYSFEKNTNCIKSLFLWKTLESNIQKSIDELSSFIKVMSSIHDCVDVVDVSSMETFFEA